MDNVRGSSAATSPLLRMSGDGKEEDDITIPIVFLYTLEASELLKANVAANRDLTVSIGT